MERPPCRVAVALLAVLLATPVAVAGPSAVGPSPAGPADASPVSTAPNTSRVLLLDGASRDGFADPSFDLSSAVSMERDSFEGALTRYTIQEQFLEAESMDARRRILLDIVAHVREDATALRERERAAREATLAGDRSVTRYVETVGRLHARAETLSGVLDTVDDFKSRVQPSGDLGERIRAARGELAPLQGEVNAHVAGRIAGDRDPFRLHVWVADTGYAVSQIDGSRYLRTAYRADNLDEVSAPTSIDDGLAIRSELYPVLADRTNNFRLAQLDQVGYEFTFRYGSDRLTAHVDSSTDRVYVESRRTALFSLPTPDEVSTKGEGMMVNVSPSYPGGPVRVATTTINGTPLATTVAVNGTVVGEAEDGVLWTLSPAGTYPVTVSTARGNVTVEVSARTGN